MGLNILPFAFVFIFAFDMQNSQGDWADLGRYAAANDSLIANQVPVDVVLMGNSITDAWPDMRPDFFRKTGFVGRGIGGQTTPQMLKRFSQDVLQLQPKIVVILAGTNDIAGNTGEMTLEETLQNIQKMITLAKENEIQVILSSVLPAADYPWSPGRKPDQKIPELNAMIQSLCKKQGLSYIDYFSSMTDGGNGLSPKLTYDGVHPNKKGYQVMEPLLEVKVSDLIDDDFR